ncbi:hypothetical protein [Pseudonocardia humida]|uniref:Phospholipase D-like protein n=1 Tax=Pseudonocardia humida TaxID=2800819 RepID=A0ABT1A2W5_9PSEU|nr:hypothetical protein [Pseudonocardia humida]MCO1657327.1 hypothetical protein [Pseudonocardia humida]
MSTTHPVDARPQRETGRTPRSVIISAVAVPLLVVGQFAMLAIVPVALVLVGTLRDARLRALRWWAGALAAAYAVPLALWAIGPERAPSLSKDMHPAFAALIVVAAVAVVIAAVVVRRRPVRDGG